MECPACHGDVPVGSTICPNCRTGVPAVQTTALTDRQAPSSPPVKPSTWLIRIGAWLLSAACWYGVLILSALRTSRAYHSSQADAVGYLVASCAAIFLIPLIAVTLYYRKRMPRPTIHRRVLVISATALALAIFSYRNSYGNRRFTGYLTVERGDALAKEGAGLALPTPDQSIWDGPVRQFFGDIAKFNRQYIAEADALDQSALEGLYSTDSFRDRTRMEKILSQLRAIRDVDQKYSSIEPIIEQMEARVRALDAPDSVKEQFLDGFTSGSEVLVNRTEVTSKEEAWMQASIELYTFTIAKKSSYFIRDNRLVFQDTAALSEFQMRMKKAEALRDDALRAKNSFDESNRKTLDKLKLRPSDLGMPSEAPKYHYAKTLLLYICI